MTRQLGLNNLNECIVFEVSIQNKRDYIFSLYKSAGQIHDKSGDFLRKFEQILCDIIARNPLFVISHIIHYRNRRFKARAAYWWRNGMTTAEGAKIDPLVRPMALVRLFLTRLIFFQILLSALTLFL